MYRIVKDGTSLGMTEAPTYVRQAGNGGFVLCREALWKSGIESKEAEKWQ